VLNDLLIIHCLNTSASNVMLLNAKLKIVFVMIVNLIGLNALVVIKLLIKDIHIVIYVLNYIKIYMVNIKYFIIYLRN